MQIATKLNRSHLINGKVAYLLPCLGRIERDEQNGTAQTVSVEDSTSCIHASFGQRDPASPHLKSEPYIVAALAKATLGEKNTVDWDAWTNDYARVRDAIEQTYPEQFKHYNKRMHTPEVSTVRTRRAIANGTPKTIRRISSCRRRCRRPDLPIIRIAFV